ncbi:MAG: VOC family protein [Planktotalea sp.]|uniref:VOC family protein n=1 Tax=Planktotalea sp. TaxID=2029877 RepID=UPI003C709530
MFDLKLDHLAVSGESRDAARAHIEEALGIPMQAGGEHARFGTHNHLMGLKNGLYLEAISIDPNAPAPDRPRWFDIDNFSGPPRLTNWICSVGDMKAACAKWPDAGDAIALERGDLRWQMAVPASGALPFDGMFPPLIEWAGTLHPASMLTPTDVSFKMLTICHPKAEALSALLGSIANALIRFEVARTAELIAEFDTPHGGRVLR